MACRSSGLLDKWVVLQPTAQAWLWQMRCHQQHLHMLEKPWLLLAQVFDDWKAFAAAAARGAGEGGAAQEPRLSNVTLAFLEACCRDEVTSETPQTVFTWLSACAWRRGGGLQACFATKAIASVRPAEPECCHPGLLLSGVGCLWVVPVHAPMQSAFDWHVPQCEGQWRLGAEAAERVKAH